MTKGIDFVYAAIDTVNELSDVSQKISKAPETQLLGDTTTVDSLVLVNLVVAIEEAIIDQTGQIVTLITEDSMIQENSPFDTVQVRIRICAQLNFFRRVPQSHQFTFQKLSGTRLGKQFGFKIESQ